MLQRLQDALAWDCGDLQVIDRLLHAQGWRLAPSFGEFQEACGKGAARTHWRHVRGQSPALCNSRV